MFQKIQFDRLWEAWQSAASLQLQIGLQSNFPLDQAQTHVQRWWKGIGKARITQLVTSTSLMQEGCESSMFYLLSLIGLLLLVGFWQRMPIRQSVSHIRISVQTSSTYSRWHTTFKRGKIYSYQWGLLRLNSQKRSLTNFFIGWLLQLHNQQDSNLQKGGIFSELLLQMWIRFMLQL